MFVGQKTTKISLISFLTIPCHNLKRQQSALKRPKGTIFHSHCLFFLQSLIWSPCAWDISSIQPKLCISEFIKFVVLLKSFCFYPHRNKTSWENWKLLQVFQEIWVHKYKDRPTYWFFYCVLFYSLYISQLYKSTKKCWSNKFSLYFFMGGIAGLIAGSGIWEITKTGFCFSGSAAAAVAEFIRTQGGAGSCRWKATSNKQHFFFFFGREQTIVKEWQKKKNSEAKSVCWKKTYKKSNSSEEQKQWVILK